MKMIETSFKQINKEEYEHTMKFEFEGKIFLVEVIETESETYVDKIFNIIPRGNALKVFGIEEYFGKGFKHIVYEFIYSNIQKVYP